MKFAQLVGSALIAGVACSATSARASVAERVVAVVGEQPILLSDMRTRARPFLLQLEGRPMSGAQHAAAESEMYKELLARLVDERVVQMAADKAHITVTSDEIDAGLRNVAGQQNLTVEQLVREAGRTGLSAQEYRDEVRRQILDGKLLQLRVRSRVRVTDDDIKATYSHLQQAERQRLNYRLAWVVLRVPHGSSPEALGDREDLAGRIAATARAGVDSRGNRVEFADLARSFSDDSPTQRLGGDLGNHAPGDLAQVIEDEATKLDVGGVSPPFRYKGDVIVIKVVSRDKSQIPAFDDVRDQLLQRAYAEQMDRARKQWLAEMRRGMHIDVRL